MDNSSSSQSTLNESQQPDKFDQINQSKIKDLKYYIFFYI